MNRGLIIIILIFCCIRVGAQRLKVLWSGYEAISCDFDVRQINAQFLNAFQKCDEKNKYLDIVSGYDTYGKDTSHYKYRIKGEIEKQAKGIYRISIKLYNRQEADKEKGTSCEKSAVDIFSIETTNTEYAKTKYTYLEGTIKERNATNPIESMDTSTDTIIENPPTRGQKINDPHKSLIYPYGIKAWEVKKKNWQWTCSSISAVGIGCGIGFSIASCHNYSNYEDMKAETRTEHSQYYTDYKLYRSLAIGSFAVGAVALISNWLYSSMKNDNIIFSPVVMPDYHGNAQFGLAMSFKF